MKNPMVLAGCAVFILAGQAHAADDLVIAAPEAVVSTDMSGAYIAARFSAAFADSTQFDLTVQPTTIINDYDDYGAAGAVAIGYDFGSYFGVELEIGRTVQDVAAHTLTAVPATISAPDAFGRTTATYGLVNAVGNFETGTAFNPYVSVGVGMADVAFENHGVTLAAPVGALGPGAVTAMDTNDIALAYQIGVGVMVDFTDKIGIELGYRHFEVSDIDLVAVDGTRSHTDLSQQQALVGLRYKF